MKNEKLFGIAERLSNLTISESKQLMDILENDYGIMGNQNVMPTFIPIYQPEVIVEQTEFDVFLKEIGLQKLQIIKKIKDLNNIGLLEGKALVESAPCLLKGKLTKEQAVSYKKELEDFGALIEIK